MKKTVFTKWLKWYLETVKKAVETKIDIKITVTKFWNTHHKVNVNYRQKKVINLMLERVLKEKLTEKKWAKLIGCKDKEKLHYHS